MKKESIIENRKNYKRNRILDVIRLNGDVSRFDIKKETAYSMSTVLGVIDELIEEGLIYEEQCQENRVGRKPVWLRLNPKGGYFIGIEFNAQKMHCAVADFAGNMVYSDWVVTSVKDTVEVILNKMKSCIDQAVEAIDEGISKVFGIGLGVPGYIDKKKGIAYSYAHIQAWKDVELKKYIESIYHVPCYMENNVSVTAFAYKWMYFKGNCQDFTFFSIRTGIRMVSVVNNRIVSSNNGFIGELGHINIQSGGRICTCGRYGCLNSEASDFSVVGKIQDGFKIGRFHTIYDMVNGEVDKVTIEHYVKAVCSGDKEAIALMKVTANAIGRALAIVVNILAPELVVLSGEQLKIGRSFVDSIKKVARENVVTQNYENLKIVISSYGSEIGAIGAASYVTQKVFSYNDMEV